MTPEIALPQIALIVASARNGVIGRNNTLPWHCPSDLKHFKALTMGKAMIMGRKTWDSLGKALPGRVSVVVSRSENLSWPGLSRPSMGDEEMDGRHEAGYDKMVAFVPTLPAAITAAHMHPLVKNRSEIMVIGGAQIYAAAMPYAIRIYRTLIDAEVEGDTFFDISPVEWRCIHESSTIQGDKDEYPLRMQTWVKL